MGFWNYFRALVIILSTGIIGGAIAHLGNQLGRYIGRKKMSIFKLRPRHTSMLITMLTGMLIASVTLILAMIFSEPVRITMLNPQEHKKRVLELESKIAQLRKLQRTDLIYKKQDIILSAVVRASSDKEKMSTALKEIIAEANRAAIKKSKMIADERRESFSVPSNGRLVGYIPENLNKVTGELSRLKGQYVIFARANSHATLGTPFFIELGTPQPNKLVYKKGELIQVSLIDGKKDYANILYDQILQKITGELTQRAIFQGLFPNPVDGSIGEYDFNKLKELSKKIKKIGKRVNLGFYATENTYTRGPLKLRFTILSNKK